MQYNPDELNDILNIFKAESEEIIQSLNDGFMELEKNPEDKTPLKKLFQLAHSIKGAARMLGFNSIQDLAHKLEDILSYWKKEEVKIEEDAFEIIYEACDLLTELVNKSVELKTDYNSPAIYTFLTKLSTFIIRNRMMPAKNPEIPQKDYIKEKNIDIKAILLELMFVLEKDDLDENLDEVVLVISENIKQLSDIFAHTEYEDIKQEIASLMGYISDNNEPKNNIDFMKQKIIDIRNSIYNLYKKLNITQSPIKETPGKEIPQPKPVETQNPPAEQKNISDNDKEIISNLDNILSNLSSIKYDKKYVKEIYDILQQTVNKTNDENVNKILSKVVNIFSLFSSKDLLIGNDCYVVILKSIYLMKKLVLKEQEENINNINFLLQRLSVVEDMFNVPEVKTQAQIQIQDSGNLLAEDNYSDLRKTLNNIDFQEIKTMRVDTVKLDNLVSQTGELLINGIKTREHIIELSKINAKLVQWNSVSKKIINYLKYLEKKGFFAYDADDSSSMFFRRTQDFFMNNAEVINEINNDFANLYNIISEDDNKLHQTTVEIESIAKGIRVLPLATLFHSFPRMIRDIAQEHHKNIDFIISGSDTTVDKKIIEEIRMPLIHILRNSVSHGIETPDDRVKNNKPDTGTIKLIAKQAENNVIITIEDDGYGVNLEKVKEIALKKNLLSEEEIAVSSNEQLMKLLFLPGFSTEESVTEISGRGIGLDVVKTKINNLNGDIMIDSVLNKGCKVTIRLPLSMSTIKTFIIMANEQKYALPVNTIKYVRQIKKEELINRNGVECIIFDNHSIPVFSLSKILGAEDYKLEEDKPITVIIIENQDKQAAFVVDKLLGDAEVFHKKLVPPILRIKNISGFTTLSTGEICLILNPFELLRNADSSLYLQNIQ